MKHVLLFSLLLAVLPITAQNYYTFDSTTVTIEEVVPNGIVEWPWEILWGPDDLLWMTDGPVIKTWDPVNEQMDILINRGHGHGMGLALHPDFPTTPWVYAIFDTAEYYGSGNWAEILRFDYNAATHTLSNETFFLTYFHPGEHSGGRLLFGTDDKLYATTGEWWPEGDSLFANNGKVLRLNEDGSVPVDNPKADYTWTWGHRNCQGMALLPDGQIVLSEHGQLFENNEINIVQKGGNYGWPIVDGHYCGLISGYADSCTSPTYNPIYPVDTFIHPPAGCEFYQHDAIPELKNKLLVGILWHYGMEAFTFDVGYTTVTNEAYHMDSTWGKMGRLRDMAVAPDGSVYFIARDREDPRIVRMYNPNHVEPPSSVPQLIAAPNNVLNFYPNPVNDLLTIERSLSEAGWISLVAVHGNVTTTYYWTKGDRTIEIRTQQLAAGAYIISYTGEDGVQVPLDVLIKQ